MCYPVWKEAMDTKTAEENGVRDLVDYRKGGTAAARPDGDGEKGKWD